MTAFAQATDTVPEPCFILGTSLRPFCLGHHLLLKKLDLPFAGRPRASAGFDQIQIGIVICGQRYEETLEQLLTGTWEKIFDQWQAEVKKRSPSKAVIREAEILFRAYLEDGYRQPPIWQGEAGHKVSVILSTPWVLALKNRLVMAGYAESEVLNGYLPGRWYDYYSVLELNAARECSDPTKWKSVFITEDDADLIVRMEQLRQSNGGNDAC